MKTFNSSLLLLLSAAILPVLSFSHFPTRRLPAQVQKELPERHLVSVAQAQRGRECFNYTGCSGSGGENALNANYPLPCYDYVLTIVFDGMFGWLYDKDSFAKHQRQAGRGEAQAIAKGRETAEWIKTTYGIDFTYLPDEAFLESTPGNFATIYDDNGGKVIFFNYLLNPSGRYRLISGSKGNEASFFNSFVSNGGWGIKVEADFTTRDGTHLAAGAQISKGDYVIGICSKDTIFGSDYSERKPLSIEYVCTSFVPPTSTVIIDCTVEHHVMGSGTARGALFPTPGTPGKYDGRNVLAFPGTQAFP
ncbi:uncharacterized protein LOC106161974 [Lingula anatina]|uniref:Uncharacterized protein LOC106161974 n=1 Tax=Lingula anatina TaxID=7574 RepID=A0A1S3IAS5_LINAN|nr:uncharacterized protein LOC106161974 [Lingula anatina]XP_013394511.1 uncharacterized protein LOC106161974 [Lingula anatina]|eukprot:XP_013394509.1 uncharacterized protein LOC106161974 [Lingula anatina]